MFTKAPWKNEKQSGTGAGLALYATKARDKKKDLGSIVFGGSPRFSLSGMVCSHSLVTLSLTINETLKLSRGQASATLGWVYSWVSSFSNFSAQAAPPWILIPASNSSAAGQCHFGRENRLTSALNRWRH